MSRGVDVADGAQRLIGLVHGQFGVEPLAQQPAAAPLGIAVPARPALRGVEFGQGRPRERGEGGLPGGGEVGKAAGALAHSEIGAGDRVESDQGVDIGVGDLTGQWAAESL